MSLLRSQRSLHPNMVCNINYSLHRPIQYWSIIRGAAGDTECGRVEMHLETILGEKSISHHFCHSVWQGEAGMGRQRFKDNRYTGEMYGDTKLTHWDSVTERIYMIHFSADRHHLVIWTTHSVIPSSWSNPLLRSFHRCMQFVWFFLNSSEPT